MSAPTLAVEDLGIVAVGRDRRDRDIVRGIGFTVREGGITAIVGESGSGKTMVGRAVMGLLPSGLAIAGGDVRLDGRSLVGLPAASLRALRGDRVGMIFQEPMVSLNPSLRIGAQMGETLIAHRGVSRAEARATSRAMLARVGIADPDGALDAYPVQFSGGMRQRIMIASVLSTRPRLLIADEPTTALDAIMRRQVMDLMVALAREAGTAILLVSHDLGMVSQYADQVLVMRRGEQVEQGATADILLTPHADYTRGLVDAMPTRGGAREAPARDVLLEARAVTIAYPSSHSAARAGQGQKRAVAGVDLAIRRGEVLAVVGESGSGKSTIGHAFMRLLAPTTGEILFRGRPLAGLDRAGLAAFRSTAQMVFQDPNSSLDPRMRLEAIVAEPLRGRRDLSAAERLGRARALLGQVGLGEGFARRFPHELSGGQRQRVAIARAIVGRPAFVVADEAVSALDVTVQAQILRLLASLRKEYDFALLFISHDLAVVEQIADRVAVMYRGHLVELGSRDDIFDRPHHPYTRSLLAATPRLTAIGAGYALIEASLPKVAARDWFEPGDPARASTLARIGDAHFVACAA